MKEINIKEVELFLINIFDRICIDTPSNFDEILKFIVNDIHETSDTNNWHDGDVSISFRRWIESNTFNR